MATIKRRTRLPWLKPPTEDQEEYGRLIAVSMRKQGPAPYDQCLCGHIHDKHLVERKDHRACGECHDCEEFRLDWAPF